MDRETNITVQVLKSDVPHYSIIGGKPSKRVQREIFEKIRFIGTDKNALRKVRENLIRNNTLQDYEKLVMTEDSDFSFCEEI